MRKFNVVQWSGILIVLSLMLMLSHAFADDFEYPLGDIPLSDAEYEAYLMPQDMVKAVALPSSYDARTYGLVTSPKDQGGCGSCWAFASVGGFESHLLKQNYPGFNTGVNLSEQQLLSCNTYGYDCGGGSSPAIEHWVTIGPIYDACFPYTASAATLCSDGALCLELIHRVENWHTVAHNTNAMKTSLYNYGPSYWRFDVYSDFQSWWKNAGSGAVYVNNNDTYKGGHAVLIIGWSDAKGAFLCKNSWGATKGPNGNGTFWIAYTGHKHGLGFGMANFELTVYTRLEFWGVSQGQYSDTVTLTAKLAILENGAPLPGKTLNFTIGGNTVSSGVTDASGIAQATMTLDQLPKSYTVVSSFAGDTNYESSSDSDPFTVNKEGTALSQSPTGTVTYGQVLTIKAKLFDDDGNTLLRQAVNPKKVYLEFFDGSGWLFLAEDTLVPPSDDELDLSFLCNGSVPPFDDGVHKIRTRFPGDAYYIDDIEEGNLTILNAPPVADAGPDQTVNEGALVTFDGTGSYDIDTNPTDSIPYLTYEWTFSDGGTAVVPQPTRKYCDNGTYTATLKVTDDDGATDTDTVKITVENAIPVVDAGADQTIMAGDWTTFTGTYSDGGWCDTHTAMWDFGDAGATAAGVVTPDPVVPMTPATGTVTVKDPPGGHPYFSAGDHTVTLAVTDDDIGVGKGTLNVKVEYIPASISFAPDTLNKKGGEKWVTVHIELLVRGDVRKISLASVQLRDPTGGDPGVPAETDTKYGFVKSEDSYIMDTDHNGRLKRMVKFPRKDVADILEVEDAVEVAVVGCVEYTNDHGDTGCADFRGTNTIKVIGKVKDPKAAPALVASSAFEASEPYPTPANPELWIPYKLGKGIEVNITIYSASGQPIRALKLGYQEAGAYISRNKAAYWDGKNEAGEEVSSGIYFYTLQAGEFTAVKKIIVSR